jgi:putative membrane protein
VRPRAEETADAFSRAGLDPYVHEHTRGTPWPSLGELIDRGERLVVFAEVEGPPPGWYHQAFENIRETPYRFEEPADFTCAPNRGDPDASLFLLNHWVQRVAPERAYAINVNSLDAIVDRARACQRERGLPANYMPSTSTASATSPRPSRRSTASSDHPQDAAAGCRGQAPVDRARRLPNDAPVVRLLISGVIYLIANAVGLLVAAGVLDDMSIDGSAFITEVLIFTAVEVLIQPLLTQIAVRNAGALVGSSALIATLVGLIVTEWLSDGLTIDGALTWVLATVIVWAAALLAGLILPVFLLKRAATSDAR